MSRLSFTATFNVDYPFLSTQWVSTLADCKNHSAEPVYERIKIQIIRVATTEDIVYASVQILTVNYGLRYAIFNLYAALAPIFRVEQGLL